MSRFFIWFGLVASLVISPFIGSVTLQLADIFDLSTLHSQIFFELRLPRVMFAFIAGAILSVSGLLFQTLFRNALLTPYTLGVSSGAVLGAGIAIKLGLGALFFGISAINIFGFWSNSYTAFAALSK